MRPQLLSDEKIGGVESDQTENPRALSEMHGTFQVRPLSYDYYMH